ncbi:DEAD/DEAH box helicase [Oceanobacillus oncorhynchi]|uniref:DEAD/DEAH box helicase n=1 Tax=Oceanobacillus oncorhynchi TaxID=545501 RepID=UPI0025A350CF|nr:DEAD/DEAH box helicase family protein [Oceanobacillus oncorhynchi]MDM8102792.1 DEAD/DEAH box helicase family protein [Oceanobacillus oncorhynchi]
MSSIEILLPEVSNILFKEPYNKNYVKQILVLSCKVSCKFQGVENNSLVLNMSNAKLYITNNKDHVPSKYKYVIYSTNKPTIEKLERGGLRLKEWIKHPAIKEYTQADVLSSWKGEFKFIEENLKQDILGLRKPQISALHMIMGHLKVPSNIGTVVMPTGTGKTETMLATLVANRCHKLLITVPSDSLREQVSDKFLSLGLLKKLNLVGKKALYPIVGVVKEGFKSLDQLETFVEKCNVIISTMTLMANSNDDQQDYLAKTASHLFIDEAHHVKAKSWDDFRKKFPAEKVIQFTATPFRNDGKKLEGKIIFNYPLKKAQEDGYFKQINFIPITEFDHDRADSLIAEAAVNKLKEDIESGYKHILMARCSSKKRAERVYDLYKKYQDLDPVVIHSDIKNRKKIYESIVQKKHKIIVCVDMLGEGFDLPELKVAAFHDIKKSLPITLQFTGRFTRTKFDENLGDASFVANIADIDVKGEIEELYARDADWNSILSNVSNYKINDVIEYEELMRGFSKLDSSNIPFQNIRPKLSAVVYQGVRKGWSPYSFFHGITQYNNLEYKFFDVNSKENIAIFIYAKRDYPDWVYDKGIYNLKWEIIVMYWDTTNRLLYINSSDNGSLYKDLAEAVIGKEAKIINRLNVFKTFHNIKRLKLQNVGLRQFLGKDIRYRMSVGTDVGQAMSLAEKQRGQKAYVQGVGYEDGEKVSIGSSYKGRTWTRLEGDLLQFKNWCLNLSHKLTNENLDPNQILSETLVPEMLLSRPNKFPVWIDWDSELYEYGEKKFAFKIDNNSYDLSKCEINLKSPTDKGKLLFVLTTQDKEVEFELELYENVENEISYPDIKIRKISKYNVEVEFGKSKLNAADFFYQYTPTIWFADGSALTGNEYVELKQSINMFPKEKIDTIDWEGVDLSKESQGVPPKEKKSIQYTFINMLKNTDLDIIYDDDYAGEIADVIGMKVKSDEILVQFFHLKYAIGGKVSNNIKNFYEVCGQAQKSIHWKHKSGDEFIAHLLRRLTKERKGISCSRLEKGSKEQLQKLFSMAKKRIPMKFEIYIVQPGLSKSKASTDILTLLGVTENFIKEYAAIDLKVIASE